MIPRKVEPLKCVHNKLLVSTHLPFLLEKYKLAKFLCFKANAYSRLVRMYHANLGVADDKLSCYVMHKHLVIDFDVIAKEFKMDASPPKLMVGDFPQ